MTLTVHTVGHSFHFLDYSFHSAETLVYSQAARSKFIFIIMGIYMSSNNNNYYTKGERTDADE